MFGDDLTPVLTRGRDREPGQREGHALFITELFLLERKGWRLLCELNGESGRKANAEDVMKRGRKNGRKSRG